MQRYKIVPSVNVPNAGARAIQIGYPIPHHMANDICIVCNGSSDFIPLNSYILCEALVNSPEILRAFGLKLVAAEPTVKFEDKPKEPEKKPARKPKTKPIVEDLGAIERSEIQ